MTNENQNTTANIIHFALAKAKDTSAKNKHGTTSKNRKRFATESIQL